MKGFFVITKDKVNCHHVDIISPVVDIASPLFKIISDHWITGGTVKGRVLKACRFSFRNS